VSRHGEPQSETNRRQRDSACEQEKLEASLPKVVIAQGKMFENAAESPASTALSWRSPRTLC
jgi:hypothetical protein